MKFNKLTNKIKLSSALIATTTIVGGGILSVPLLLSTNNTNSKISSNLDYGNIVNQNNKQAVNASDLSSQPAEIQDFFATYANKTIYADSDSANIFAVVTRDDGFDVLYAWGENLAGQLGVGDNTNKWFPTLVTGLPTNCKITHLASSNFSTTIVINGTDVWATGSNADYELGFPGHANTNSFVNIGAHLGSTVKSLHAGAHHRVLATTSGQVYVWGRNEYGQLGTGENISQTSPVHINTILDQKIPNWSNGKFFASGYNTAILVDGHLYMWGINSQGETGNGNTRDVFAIPTAPVNVGGRIKEYSMGFTHSLAILENGHLWSWGHGGNGRLGSNSVLDKPIPSRVVTGKNAIEITNVTKVVASRSASFIQIGNNIYSCGENYSGILAQGAVDSVSVFSPVMLYSGTHVLDINSNSYTLMVNLEDGLYMAGYNGYGAFANGIVNAEPNYTLMRVSPFGEHSNFKTKPDNSKYIIDNVITDLNSKINSHDIRITLAKYIDGVDSLPTESVLTYKVRPVANADKTKVTLTLNTNRSFNSDGAKIDTPVDIPIEIANFNFRESAFKIKYIPTNMHTGEIKTILNPRPGTTPSELWLNEIVDMDEFPAGTTFVKIIDDKVIPGAGSNTGIYEGKIVPSKYYSGGSILTTPEKQFPFQLTGLTKVADSAIVSFPTPSGYDIDNIENSLKNGSIINLYVLNKFIDINRFPVNAVFAMGAKTKDTTNNIFSFEIIPTLHYKNGLTENNTYREAYQVTIQFDAPKPQPPTPEPQVPAAASSTNFGLIIGLIVGGIVLLAIIIFIIWRVAEARKNREILDQY